MKCRTCGMDSSQSYTFRDRRQPFKIGVTHYYCIKCIPKEVLDITPPEVIRVAKQQEYMKRWNVTLPSNLVDQAWFDAAANQEDSANRKANWGMKASQKPILAQNADARGAELAFAMAIGMTANPYVGMFEAPDVGEIYQVKQTPWPDGYLRIPKKHSEAQKNQCFVLVIGELPKFFVKGWIHAQEGMKTKFFHRFEDGNEAWKVEQRYLHTMDTLPMPPDYTSTDLPEGLVFIPVKQTQQQKRT